MSTIYPARNGNQIQTFLGGHEFHSHLQMRCENAVSDIWFGLSFVDWKFEFSNGIKWWKFLINLKKAKPDLIIRILIWRNNNVIWKSKNQINGDKKDFNFIKMNNIHKYIQLKWDESPNIHHCHHQKYYIIDKKYGLIGGMPLSGHKYFNFTHDTFMEIIGESTCDIMMNYKLRWNHNNIYTKCCAMDICKTTQINYNPDNDNNDNDIDNKSNDNDPDNVSVQICWSCSPKLYPGFDDGIQSIHDEYCRAFINAQSSIYIESQHMGEYKLLSLMKNKLESNPDFCILYIVPMWMAGIIHREKLKSVNYLKNPQSFDKKPRYHDTFQMLSSLKKYKNFCLSGLYHDHNNLDLIQLKDKKDKKQKQLSFWNRTINSMLYNQIPKYVHSKLCIVDGKWFTIGSANMVDISFLCDHTEINAMVTNQNESMKLLKRLAVLHCNKQFAVNNIFNNMNDKEIIKYMIKCAQNKTNGLYQLDPEHYGTSKQTGMFYKMISFMI